tara:strand:+ start:12830 stop:13900 length:1071 start_codon:yes stop_codon:yes gene_type:complete
MKNKIIGVEFSPLEKGERAIAIKLPKETIEYLNSLVPKKDWRYYLIEFLQTEKNYNKYYNIVEKGMDAAMPLGINENCPKCGENAEPIDSNLGYEVLGNCSKYQSQMWATYYIAANEFVHIVKRNKFIYDNKPLLFDLTEQFFHCIAYQKGKGIMYFDLNKLCSYILKVGFLSISEFFAKSTCLQNLNYINETLNIIGEEEIDNKIFDKEDENFLALQREFFENKQKYYDRELLLKKEQLRIKSTTKDTPLIKTPSISHYVLYFYYLQVAGIYPYFEHHPEGKVKAIEELLEKEKINTTSKYFQLKFNFISHHQTNRIAKNQETNIDFVINQMLIEYPKAKIIAENELKLAKSKHR